MSRATVFTNTAGADIISATANNYKDVVSITGSGVVDYLVCKVTDTPANIDKYAIEVDGTAYPFAFDLPFSGEFGMLYNNATQLIQTNKPIFYNTSFKLQAYYNTADTLTFKYSVMSHQNQ